MRRVEVDAAGEGLGVVARAILAPEEQVDEAARERLVGRFRTLSLDALRHVGTVVYLRRR